MYILGAGTLGEMVLETAIRAGLKVRGFYDDVTEAATCDGIPVLGGIEAFRGNREAMAQGAFVAIGDNRKRQSCAESLRAMGVRFPNVIDPRAIVSPSAALGQGNLVMPGAYIGAKCSVGSGNLFFPGVSITHHNRVGDYGFFSPNASVGGFTRIGDGCKVGMSCVVLPYRAVDPWTEADPSTIVEGRLLSASGKAMDGKRPCE